MRTVTDLARRAVLIYPHNSYTDRRAVNALRRGWIAKIQYLGDRWLLAVPVARKSPQPLDIPL